MFKCALLVCILLVSISVFCEAFKIGDLDFGASEFKEGSGKEHKAAHFEQRGEKGDKGYKLFEEQSKGAKGFHDKERHKNAYTEEDGNKKSYHHTDGYFAEKHGGQKGSKGLNYEDHGHYAKGHKTKGRHNIHKLNEYKKKTDFYDEDHDEGHKEKHGGYELKKEIRDGGYHKKGHKNRSFLESLFGKLGSFDKGNHYFQDAGHKKAAGQEEHYEKGSEFAKEGSSDELKKFGFSEGHKL